MQSFRTNRRFQSWKAATRARQKFVSHRWCLMLTFGLGVLASVQDACGQEALRLSLAGDAAASAQSDAAASIGYYNLLVGHTALRFSAGLELQYNDNVRLQPNPQGDLLFSPNMNTQVHWPLTENNSLEISLGAGYNAYVNNENLDQFFVTPGSGISFNLYVGDFAINLHDRLTVTENGYQNPVVNGNGNNASLQNTAGTSATWDLNQLVVSAGYDHANYVPLYSGLPSQPDASSENFSASGGVRLRPEILVGVEAGGSLVGYGSAASPNTAQWNSGAFGRVQISEYMSAQLDAGYTESLPESSTATVPNAGGSSSYYFDFSLTHRINQYIHYTLSASHSTDFQYYGQPYTYYSVQWQPSWNIFRQYSVSTPFAWQHGTQAYGQGNGFDQYSAGINVGHQITEKFSGALSYQFIRETAVASSSYFVNIIGLNFSYQF